MKNSRFKESQCLINTKHQIKYQSITDISIIQWMKIVIENKKFTNLSKDFLEMFRIN